MTDPETFLETYERDCDRQDVERRAEPDPDYDPGELDDRDTSDGCADCFSIWDWLE